MAASVDRLSTDGELMTDPPRDLAERDRQLARVVAAFPFVTRAPDWLAFLREYGGLTWIRDHFSTGFFGVSYNASVHLLDGEGDPVESGCLLICDADPPLRASNGVAPDELAGDGRASQGVALDGLASDGPASQGVALDGLASDGPASQGVALDGLAGDGRPGGGFAAFGFDATGDREWGVYGVTTDGRSEWYAPTFTDWLEQFVVAVT